MRRNLVLVRAGLHSTHHKWKTVSRTWDLAVSSFDVANADQVVDGADYLHVFAGGKWDGIYNFFSLHPDLLVRYDRIWLPDDDIEIAPQAVDELFRTAERERFELCQPSLQQGSFVSHLIVLHNPLFHFRRTNFVEVMAPLLSAEVMKRVLPHLEHTQSGVGLDFVWARLVDDRLRAVAIIDDVIALHPRPVGVVLQATMKEMGRTTGDDLNHIISHFGELDRVQVSLSGLLIGGARITGVALTSTIALAGWLARPFGNREFTHPISVFHFLRWNLVHWRNSLHWRG